MEAYVLFLGLGRHGTHELLGNCHTGVELKLEALCHLHSCYHAVRMAGRPVLLHSTRKFQDEPYEGPACWVLVHNVE